MKFLYGRRHFDQDRISSLPDDLLLLVLSFLSFKEVIRTSLVSHRWRNVWLHTPVLVFQAPFTEGVLINDTERRDYMEWVDCVLQRHKCPYLKEFKIVCQLDKCNDKDIERWLVFAFARKVERLELNFMVSRCFPINMDDLYTFDSRFLDFNNGKAITDPCKGRLKCLKSLTLKRVDVTSETINFILLNCPFLEHLELEGTLKLADLVISDPTLALKCLKIDSCYHLKVVSISNLNLVSLKVPSSVDDLTLKNLPILVELSIQGELPRLSQSFSQASCFFSQLEAFTFNVIALKDAALLSNTDKLTKLKRLVIHVAPSDDESLTMLIPIIYSCPQLEEFVLKLSPWMRKKTIGTTEVERRVSPSSLQKSKSLKVFEFFGYDGLDEDVELIMEMAENAVALEKIIIDLSEPGYDDASSEFVRSAVKLKATSRRNIALQQFVILRKSMPTHIHLLIRPEAWS